MNRFQRKTLPILRTALVALALAFTATGPARAGDLPILTQGAGAAPNILILLDSSGSMDDQPASAMCWGCPSKRTIAKDALRNLVLAVNPPDGAGGYTENARFGLAQFRANGAQLLVPIADGNTQAVLNAAANVFATAVGTPIAGAALDIGRYYAGANGWGTLDNWGTLAGESIQPSPFDLSCRKSFIIYITDGLPVNDSMIRAGYWNTVGDADGDLGVGEGNPENNSATVSDPGIQWGDDITLAMFQRDFAPGIPGKQNITTHVVGFDVDTPILERMADNGGGSYYRATNASDLADALAAAAQEVMDSVASFSSAVVPASRTVFGAAFYNAYFEPRSNKPFWAGHLEAYRLAMDGEILDRNGNPAVDPATGQLVDPHEPFWDAGERLANDGLRDIYTTIGGVQTRFEIGNVTSGDLAITSAEIPFYPNAGSSGIDTLGELRDAIIRYVHGKDGFDEDQDGNFGELRSVVLGDIFHSTPRVVAAPSTLLAGEGGYVPFLTQYYARDRVIYVGANDGLLHAFDAGSWNVGDDPTTPETENGYYSPGSGDERFGYLPGPLLDDVKMIPRNSPRTFYYVDGSPVVAEAWLGDGSGNDVTKSADEWASVLVTGLREGGPGYLALDVTNPDAMAGDPHGPYPVMLWEFNHPKLGESWSEPVITRVKVRGSAGSGDFCGADDVDGDCREQWVAIFAGGYEKSADPNSPVFVGDPATAGWSDRGKAIFMVALDSGQLLASVEYDSAGVDGPTEMIYALPSNPAVLDLDFDGFADVVYIGDLGGQVWKWDVKAVGEDTAGDARIDNWTAGVFFRTAPTAVAGGVLHYRSFYDPPAASYLNGALTLTFGSGERNDLSYAGDAAYAENNRFYMVADDHPTGPLAFGGTLTDADLTDVTNVDTDPDPTDAGFFFTLPDSEKFVGSPLVFAGYVIASSYAPASGPVDPCGTAGTASLYAFRLRDGKGLFDDPIATPMEKRKVSLGGGLPSAPRVSLGSEVEDDQIYIKTSKGDILTVDPPDRGDGSASIIYWTRKF